MRDIIRRAFVITDWLMFSIVGVLVLALAIPVRLLTQDIWAPFDAVRSVSVDADDGAYYAGNTVIVTWNLEVFHRYPVEFSTNLYNPTNGRIADERTRRTTTGKMGRFSIAQETRIPYDAEPGTWCHIVVAHVRYNVMLEVSRPYDPVCFEVM